MKMVYEQYFLNCIRDEAFVRILYNSWAGTKTNPKIRMHQAALTVRFGLLNFFDAHEIMSPITMPPTNPSKK